MRPSLLVGGVLVVASGLFAAGCLQLFYRVEAEEVAVEPAPVEVEAPLKVHLVDGGVALFPGGARFSRDSLLDRFYGLERSLLQQDGEPRPIYHEIAGFGARLGGLTHGLFSVLGSAARGDQGQDRAGEEEHADDGQQRRRREHR